MGKKLTEYYELVENHSGLAGKVRLAMSTQVPSVLAAGTEETPDLLARFAEAVEKITGQPQP